jgi:hypothetical protein
VDELIKKVTERAGINADQAKKAVQSVIDFIQEKVPGVGGQIKALIEGKAGGLGEIAGKIGDLLGGKKG